MKPKHARWNRSNWSALAASVFLHAFLAFIAIFGLPRWSTPLPAAPPVITGSLVESPTAARKARDVAERQAREEAERLAEAERLRVARIEAEKQARQEAERKAKAEAEKKAREEEQRIAREKAQEQARIEAESKARAESERVAKEAAAARAREEAERKAEAERQAKAEAEQKAKAEAARKAKEEAERKARAEAQRKARAAAEKKAREEELANALTAEQDAMDRTTWGARLGAHIQKFWVRPAGANEDFSCIVRIRQSRYGDVLARSIVRTCGNDFLDNSVLDAVDEASPLPLPRNPRVFDEVVEIKFVPF